MSEKPATTNSDSEEELLAQFVDAAVTGGGR
jgi:hypothetical protein